ncbi:hypothetical protein ACHAXT_010666 [Thalassiosira profunda]
MTASSASTEPTLAEPFHAAHFAALPHAACVTLYHRNGRAGCGTFGREVQTGRLLEWTSVVGTTDEDENSDKYWVQGGASAVAGGATVPPYVAVMNEEEYTAENVAKLVVFAQNYAAGDHYGEVAEGGPLRGVLVLPSNATDCETDGEKCTQFDSPEPLAPQGENTPSASLAVGASFAWNYYNNGDGLTNADMYGIPTAYVADVGTANYLRGVASDQSNALWTSTADNNGEVVDVDADAHPAIVGEFNYYMGPGGEVDGSGNAVYDSAKCLGWVDTNGERSPRCAPLGGNSVWAVAGTPVPLGYSGDANNNNGENGDNNNGNGNRSTILVSTSIDSTSMFHDLSPGANNAASNTLALLMAANLIGSSITDEVLDQLYGRIAFAFFQGESYGYIGSRRFVKDIVGGFECTDGNEGVPSVYKRKDEENVARACLHPTRADLTFQNLGDVRGTIAVDQVANLDGGRKMYVQGGDGTDGGNGFAGFLSETMIELSTNDANGYSAQASSAEDNGDGVTPLPPTPLSSLVSVSGSAVGGVVLTGYDNAFVTGSLYHSHLDSSSGNQASEKQRSIDKDAIASAATLIARSAVAAAYQDADSSVDAATASAYALNLLPNAVDASSETFANLYTCLFEDGNCETFLTHGGVERANDALRTGHDLGMGVPLGTPPSFYTSIYDSSNGQAFVLASGHYYGSLTVEGETKGEDGETIKAYGESDLDAFLVRPSLLEMAISGLLNDFLGRGAFTTNEGGVEGAPELASCKSSKDCGSVSYCDSESTPSLVPTCAGGSCVCGSRAHYHQALDEALEATANMGPGMFDVREDDEGISALYTEPYWSNYVGVRIYNDAGNSPGVYAASIGAVFALASMVFVWRLKKKMTKEKVY